MLSPIPKTYLSDSRRRDAKRVKSLSDETMQKFGLGYSDQYSDDLYKYLRSKGYDDEILKETGLVTIDEVRGGDDKFWYREWSTSSSPSADLSSYHKCVYR